MAVVRMHRYTVEPTRLPGAAHPAGRRDRRHLGRAPRPVGTRLTRLEDGTFTNIWRWDSAAQMQAAFAAVPTHPEVAAAMSLARNATAQNGEIIDER